MQVAFTQLRMNGIEGGVRTEHSDGLDMMESL
jgi:hypothetical protein